MSRTGLSNQLLGNNKLVVTKIQRRIFTKEELDDIAAKGYSSVTEYLHDLQDNFRKQGTK